ncbi:efflux transporter outer membrane subunit [Rhodomicrobium sp.]|uniref:efflux transporter outer membrane subunit n=1 Tax=Rhodomicrobium sp. TaxID=2720632 RepID=UPI0039E6FE57
MRRDNAPTGGKTRLLRGAAAAVLIGALSAGGCTGLDPNVASPQIAVPDAYKGKSARPSQHPAGSPYDFAAFRSRKLTDLIAAGRGFNLDIAAAIARVEQAEAQVRVASQALIPTIQADGSGTRSFSHATGRAVRGDTVVGQLGASYELDFWGKNRSGVASAIASQAAADYAAATVAITTDATIATTYFDAVATQKQIDIAKANLAIAQRTLDAIVARNKAGTTSGLDVAQQETLVANVKVTIPPLQRQLEQYKHALAVLVGRAPEFFSWRADDLYAIVVPQIPAGLPSELLCRRPDIADAEATLAAQRFAVSKARAAMFPSIQLTGAGGFQSAALASLFQPQSTFYNAAAGLTQPITNMVELQATLDQNRALYTELLATYKKTIIAAFQDVEDALVAYRKTAEQERLQREAVQAARRAYEISQAQLQGGIIDITTLLSIQQTLFSAENSLALVRQARLEAAVSLYRALGGGWSKPEGVTLAEVPSLIDVKRATP